MRSRRKARRGETRLTAPKVAARRLTAAVDGLIINMWPRMQNTLNPATQTNRDPKYREMISVNELPLVARLPRTVRIRGAKAMPRRLLADHACFPLSAPVVSTRRGPRCVCSTHLRVRLSPPRAATHAFHRQVHFGRNSEPERLRHRYQVQLVHVEYVLQRVRGVRVLRPRTRSGATAGASLLALVLTKYPRYPSLADLLR